MNNQKDTQKTDYNSSKINGAYVDVRNQNSLQDKPIYEFAHKKTEKLITALYMVTDCMEQEEALKNKLRSSGVNLLSDIYKLPLLSPVEKHHHLNIILSSINEITTFVHIACTIGFISSMNGSILKKEFGILSEELKTYQNTNQQSSFGNTLFESKRTSGFTLNEKMFEIDSSFKNVQELTAGDYNIKDSIKDNNLHNYKTAFSGMSFTKKSPIIETHKGQTNGNFNLINKTERTTKIVSLIKDIYNQPSHKDLPADQAGVSIKEVSSVFMDCSEKTIQRELNNLVSKGELKKIGAKRWSRYLPTNK